MALTRPSNDMLEGPLGTVALVTSRVEAKAVNLVHSSAVMLIEGARAGLFFVRDLSDYPDAASDTNEGIYLLSTFDVTKVLVRDFSGPANVRWFGAIGNGVTNDLVALQATSDLCQAVYIPDGAYITTAAWNLRDYATLYFESRDAIIQSSSLSSIIAAVGGAITRNYHITIYGGQIRGGGTGSAIGLDFRSVSMAKVYGTWITQCFEGVHNGGVDSVGAYYNDFFGVDITTCLVGYRNGTLGNEIKVFGGRITDVSVGTDDDDNSGILYDGVAIETFTLAGHRLSNSGLACVDVRSVACRFENPAGNPAYASATGIKIAGTAQDTTIIAPGFSTVATDIDGVGVRTTIIAYEGTHRLGLPTSSAGLATGTLWNDGGTVKVV